MTLRAENMELDDPAQAPGRSQRAEVTRFFTISTAFLAGFIVVALTCDRLAGVYLEHSAHRGGIAPDALVAKEEIRRKSGQVRVVFLGDSVSRQLFHPGHEPRSDVRFATCSQAITLAGQYYLADEAMRDCPHLQDIYLFYLPAAWLNNMPRDFTHDYFCAHFHAPAQVAEVFAVKRDVELSLTHAGRCLFPNVLMANSLSQPAFSFQPQATQGQGPAPTPPDPERLLTQFSAILAPRPDAIPPEPPGRLAVFLSPTSRYYLAKLREDCRRHGVRLHILPCPVSQEKSHVLFVDEQGLYDAPMIQDIPADHLVDAVHFKSPYVPAARERVIRFYKLASFPFQ